jgi:hypothetical protein
MNPHLIKKMVSQKKPRRPLFLGYPIIYKFRKTVYFGSNNYSCKTTTKSLLRGNDISPIFKAPDLIMLMHRLGFLIKQFTLSIK